MKHTLFIFAFFLGSQSWAGSTPKHIDASEGKSFHKGHFSITDYLSKAASPNISLAKGSINGLHGPTKNTRSDRIYYILHGEAQITAGKENFSANKGDTVYIPKNTEHSLMGQATYLVINSPAFDSKYEVDLGEQKGQ